MTEIPTDRVDTTADGEQLSLLAVHAHPDDESSKGSATMAKYVREGARVTVVTLTGGERGSILNPKMMDDPEALADLPALRRVEMERAQKVIGFDHIWLGFVDSGLPEGDPLPELPEGSFALMDVDEAARPLVEVIRRVKPQVMTTYNEHGGYPHPDHIMCHRVSMRAFELAADPAYEPDLGEPWQISKVYYDVTFSRQRFSAIARYLRGRNEPNEFLEERLMHFDESQDRIITTRIPVADYLQYRDDALRAHASQVDPDGFFFAVSHEVQNQAWPTEDFELRTSRIGVTLPETDLFAGIR